MSSKKYKLIAIIAGLVLMFLGVLGMFYSSMKKGNDEYKKLIRDSNRLERLIEISKKFSEKVDQSIGVEVDKSQYRVLDFATLGDFPYGFDGPEEPGQTVPESIGAWNGEKVAISGFVMPLLYIDDKPNNIILVPSLMHCCFGVPPRMNEWVEVDFGDVEVPGLMNAPVTVYGIFDSGEKHVDDYIESLYRLEGERLEIRKMKISEKLASMRHNR